MSQIADIGGPRAVEILVQQLDIPEWEADWTFEKKLAIMKLIRMIGGSKAAAALCYQLDDAKRWAERAKILREIAKIKFGRSKAIEILNRRIQHVSGRERQFIQEVTASLMAHRNQERE
jgi:hypothetical protein